jgi:hypothetical protein
VGRGAGLGVGHGHVVGHDVVQVASDAHPFLGDPQPGFLFAGPLGVLGPGLDGFEPGVAQPGPAAHRQREQQPQGGPDRA